jgi:hypothetical protein
MSRNPCWVWANVSVAGDRDPRTGAGRALPHRGLIAPQPSKASKASRSAPRSCQEARIRCIHHRTRGWQTITSKTGYECYDFRHVSGSPHCTGRSGSTRTGSCLCADARSQGRQVSSRMFSFAALKQGLARPGGETREPGCPGFPFAGCVLARIGCGLNPLRLGGWRQEKRPQRICGRSALRTSYRASPSLYMYLIEGL